MEDNQDELFRIRTILMENPKGLTIEEIAKKLPLNRTSTAKYLNTLQISGQAEMRTFGRAKVFTVSQRLPFSKMLNLSSDLLFVLDHGLIINQVNDALKKTFNTPQDALVGVRIDDSPLAPYLGEKNLAVIKDAAGGKEYSSIERIEIGGKEYFFQVEMIPVVFDQGEQGLAVVLKDITELKQYQQHLEHLVEERTTELRTTNTQLLNEIEERRKSQAALEQSERKYRELVENANSIILRVNEKGSISFFNEFAERFFGTSEPEMLGKNIIGTILPAAIPDGKTSEEQVREFLKPTEYMVYNEIPCLGKDGKQAWVAWTIRPVKDVTNVPVEYLLVGMDITDRKNVETALQRVNAKLNLVSSIARHDILNKLTIISGTISLLMETIRDKKQLDYLQNAEQAMHAIKNQILFTRDYKDMGMEKADWQDIEATINRAVANNHGKYLHFDFRVKGLEIFADPWLMKVFFNLTDNMIRFGLSTNTIYVSSKESEDGLDVYFEGEGKGIPADQKEIIFQHGYGDTNGFGLFLAREILAITGITVKETGDTEKKVRFELRIPRRAYRFRAIEIPDKK
jgi:PAS domain S-box-containing protein